MHPSVSENVRAGFFACRDGVIGEGRGFVVVCAFPAWNGCRSTDHWVGKEGHNAEKRWDW